jgi:hypothetical protein
MNVVLGWLATLDSGKQIRDVYSALTVIRRNAELQAHLIEELLDMNRFMSDNVTTEYAFWPPTQGECPRRQGRMSCLRMTSSLWEMNVSNCNLESTSRAQCQTASVFQRDINGATLYESEHKHPTLMVGRRCIS